MRLHPTDELLAVLTDSGAWLIHSLEREVEGNASREEDTFERQART
jgi:hypothetical protein